MSRCYQEFKTSDLILPPLRCCFDIFKKKGVCVCVLAVVVGGLKGVDEEGGNKIW